MKVREALEPTNVSLDVANTQKNHHLDPNHSQPRPNSKLSVGSHLEINSTAPKLNSPYLERNGSLDDITSLDEHANSKCSCNGKQLDDFTVTKQPSPPPPPQQRLHHLKPCNINDQIQLRKNSSRDNKTMSLCNNEDGCFQEDSTNQYRRSPNQRKKIHLCVDDDDKIMNNKQNNDRQLSLFLDTNSRPNNDETSSRRPSNTNWGYDCDERDENKEDDEDEIYEEKVFYCLDKRSLWRRWAICITRTPYLFHSKSFVLIVLLLLILIVP